MASEHVLRLKAVLDTEEVKRELDRLRQQQAQEQAQEGGAAPVRSGAPAEAPQFKRLDQTLQRLNQSVQRLQRSVDQLGRGVKQAPEVSGTQGGLGMPVIPGKWVPGRGEKAVTQNWLNSKEYARLNRDFTRQVRRDIASGAIPADLFSGDGLGTREFYDNVFKQEGVLSEADRREYLNKRREFNERINNSPSEKARIAQMRQNRRLGGLVAGQLIGGAAGIAQDLGYDRTGTVLGALGKGVSAGFGTALTVTMLGGSNPFSLAAGVIAGLAAAAADARQGLAKLAQTARDAYVSQLEASKALRTAGSRMQDQASLERQRDRAEAVVKEFDEGEASLEAGARERQYRRLREKWLSMRSPEEYSDAVQDAAFRRMAGMTDDAEKAAVQKQANKQVQEYQARWQEAKREADAAEQLWQVWKQATDQLKEQREAAEKLQEAEKERADARRKAFAESAGEFRLNALGEDAVGRTAAFANAVLHDRRASALGQFRLITPELDAVREQRNSFLTKAYEANRKILEGAAAGSPEALQKLQDERRDAMRQAGFAEQRISLLENALQNLNGYMERPDFSHMTSLAQYGFNMGEKEDQAQVAERYYSRMTDLTQQIRDKLDQGVTTRATYSE